MYSIAPTEVSSDDFASDRDVISVVLPECSSKLLRKLHEVNTAVREMARIAVIFERIELLFRGIVPSFGQVSIDIRIQKNAPLVNVSGSTGGYIWMHEDIAV